MDVAAVILEAFIEEFGSFIQIYGFELVQTFMARSLRIECFRLVELEGQVAGVLALTQPATRGLAIDKAFLKDKVGWFQAKIIEWGMKEVTHPLKLREQTAYIEFVGVKKAFRRQGIAQFMMSQVIKDPDYAVYMLDVKDSNHKARTLYEKLGFVEWKKKPKAFLSLHQDVKEFIIMEYVR